MDWLKALMTALGPKFFKRRGPDRDFRIKSNLTARILDDGGNIIQGRVANLSRRGFKLMLPVLVPRDQDVLVQLLGDVDPQASIKLEARMAWSKKQPKWYDAGFEWRGFYDTQFDDVVAFFRSEVALDVEETARRLRSPRLPMPAYPVRYSFEGDHRSYAGTVQNLSLTGLRFRGEEPVELGTILHIFIELGPRKKLGVVARVRRCTEVTGGGWDLGATLKTDDDYNQELLRAELASHQGEPAKA
ncbi:MAG TPA: PilZ domain-containing protein [Candidatus Xenobia bacterium]|jgi:hypothetical protein